ncbi:hypothetical protein ACHAW6_010112 [Cyclotella cf. meneghiniana]
MHVKQDEALQSLLLNSVFRFHSFWECLIWCGEIIILALVLITHINYHSALEMLLGTMVLPTMVETNTHVIQGNVNWGFGLVLAIGGGEVEVGIHLEEDFEGDFKFDVGFVSEINEKTSGIFNL